MAGSAVIVGPPDFIGVGTQRSGTTWWQRLLMNHPAIHLPLDGRKEQHFFDWFGKTELEEADIARYHEQFPRPQGELAGEWTPRYMRDVWAPRLIARAAPEAKLLVMFRDPLERYRSGVLHSLARRGKRDATWLSTDAVERGRYAVQLKRVLDYFDESQILVLQFERCIAEPLEQYHRTLDFLGLPPDHVPTDLTRTRGTPTSPRREPIWEDLKLAVTRELEPDVAELSRLVPDLDLELWPNFAHLAAGGPRGGDRKPRPPAPAARPRSDEGGPPDYVGVGTTYSGWNWWDKLLLEHPSIEKPGRQRSLEFFQAFCTRAMTDEDIDAYHARFRRPADKLVGEWTPHYMYETWTPLLLRRAAPEAKLLVMLVDPLSRWAANLAESRRKRDAGERTVNRAAETDFLSNSLSRGRYAQQLRGVLEHYERDQVLVLQFERCAKDPLGQYARTLRFLGISDDFRPPSLKNGLAQRARRLLSPGKLPSGAPVPARADLWPDVEIPLLGELEPDVLDLQRLVPDLDLALWPRFAHLAAHEAAGDEPLAARA